jgi:acetyl esterase/lipase
MKKQFFTSALTLLIATLALGQQKVIQLYDGPAPGSESWNWTEAVSENNAWGAKLVYNVSIPTLTVYSPAPDKANGTAAVICPGGAFVGLAIDHEGTNVAKWLVEKGITCFVLKYRLVRSFTTDPAKEFTAKGSKLESDPETAAFISLAKADGLAAIQYLRKHADDFNIDPNRVGIIGFSAGGTVAASSLYNYSKETRPDFAATLYPYFPPSMHGGVPKDAPPLFIAAANDDEYAPHSVDLYTQWHSSKLDAELHMYAKGGHGFGTRVQNFPTDKWMDRFGEWLGVQGLLKSQKKK